MGTQEQIEAFLRQAIQDSGLSQGKLSRATGVPQPCLSKFLSGQSRLDLVSIDKLLTFFGKELAIRPKPSTPALPPAPSVGGSTPVLPPAPRPPEVKEKKPAPLRFQEPAIFDVPERLWKKMPKW